MASVVQNGWDQLAVEYIDLVALTLLYYDYALTLGSEIHLFWSKGTSKGWGSILFFLNRYCGVVGHLPIFIQLFARPGTAIYNLCKPIYAYHQVLAVVMEGTVALSFATRTYALYESSRIVLAVLISLSISGIVIGGATIFGGEKLPSEPVLPEGSIGCSIGLSYSQSRHLVAGWCGVLGFDIIVVVMTLTRTIQIHRWRGGSHALTKVLMRDGVVYFGFICLVTLSNVLSFLYGTELTRGISTTLANTLSSTLVSRLMLNLRREGESSVVVDPSLETSIPLEFRGEQSTQDTC